MVWPTVVTYSDMAYSGMAYSGMYWPTVVWPTVVCMAYSGMAYSGMAYSGMAYSGMYGLQGYGLQLCMDLLQDVGNGRVDALSVGDTIRLCTVELGGDGTGEEVVTSDVGKTLTSAGAATNEVEGIVTHTPGSSIAV